MRTGMKIIFGNFRYEARLWKSYPAICNNCENFSAAG